MSQALENQTVKARQFPAPLLLNLTPFGYDHLPDINEA